MTNEITKKRRDAITALIEKRAKDAADEQRDPRNSAKETWMWHCVEDELREVLKGIDALDAAEAKMGEPDAWMVKGLLRDGTKVLRLPVLTSREDAELYSIRNPDEVLVALYAAPPAAEPVKPTHRHKKRGSEYVLIGYGKMQVESWVEPIGAPIINVATVDMREVAIYRSVDDGALWVRPREEFEDGRFEPLAAAPAPVSVSVSEKEAE